MNATKSILVDAREWNSDRMTGIGRMLTGCVSALAASPLIQKIVLAFTDENAVPAHLNDREHIAGIKIPESFLRSEWELSELSKKGFDAFISPYPKLPLFGVHCPSVHTIHDVLDLTNPLYRKRIKAIFDKYRLKKAICRADLTWYDSLWSMKETEALVRATGRNPRVRHLGVDDRFSEIFQDVDLKVLEKYGLKINGYILVIGNGLPHKNLGLLLGISDRISRKHIFIGVSKHNQRYWARRYPTNQADWIEQVEDAEMPALLRHAFCLSQPSLAEGYGYPPLEAMACGTPAVISNIPVLVETTGGNALAGDPHNGQSWIELYKYIENDRAYRAQAEKGFRWIMNLRGQSGWLHHVADVEDLIES